MRNLSERLLLVLACLTSPALLAETLFYEASYQGLFSAGQAIAIGAISLDTAPVDQPGMESLFQSEMQVTSRPYAFVEKHYPFRVRYRSLWSSRPLAVMGMETYEKTRRVKHRIIWVDGKHRRMLKFRAKGKRAGEQVFPVSLQRWLAPDETFQFHKYGRHEVPRGMLDWLSMLQAVRGRKLQHGRQYRYTVTDGKHLYHYRVTVENRHLLAVDGKNRPVWKLRFEATEEGKSGPAHRPVFVWLTDDENHLPVQFESRHPLGRFTIRLSEATASAFQ
ncbi:DUF3108 domain-containing protein [Thiolapillus brandeum]|uniref:DUF3108 domain-containing protein n=1 Tax=Thiolapillus brandeum TaxID=1076588 RepID=A0A7U6GJG1_9GAMM|nr:DUF3108 domain-containing protein [Thiolapillus brandeum]BAO44760.1 hypothetical protein TBH_C1845 [Thiolapillus brandeum]